MTRSPANTRRARSASSSGRIDPGGQHRRQVGPGDHPYQHDHPGERLAALPGPSDDFGIASVGVAQHQDPGTVLANQAQAVGHVLSFAGRTDLGQTECLAHPVAHQRPPVDDNGGASNRGRRRPGGGRCGAGRAASRRVPPFVHGHRDKHARI
jgi:hypothetical protein